MSSNTVVNETAREKAVRRNRVNNLYERFPFLNQVVRPGYVSDGNEITRLPDDFLQLPHQPDGTGVVRIYFFLKDGVYAGTVGSFMQRVFCGLLWNYSLHEKVSDAIKRLGSERMSYVEHVVIYSPLMIEVYTVPEKVNIWNMFKL